MMSKYTATSETTTIKTRRNIVVAYELTPGTRDSLVQLCECASSRRTGAKPDESVPAHPVL